jgi:hypothetical protein
MDKRGTLLVSTRCNVCLLFNSHISVEHCNGGIDYFGSTEFFACIYSPSPSKTVVCIRETAVVSEHANVIIIFMYLCALLSDGMYWRQCVPLHRAYG